MFPILFDGGHDDHLKHSSGKSADEKCGPPFQKMLYVIINEPVKGPGKVYILFRELSLHWYSVIWKTYMEKTVATL